MSFDREYTEGPFPFGGKQIEARFETMPGEAESVIGDLVRKDQIGTAQAGAAHVALKVVKADGEVIFKNNAKGAQRTRTLQGINQLPSTREYYDRETKTSLVRRLLQKIVEHEFWLVDMFPEAFEEFVGSPEERVENPTVGPVERNISKVS